MGYTSCVDPPVWNGVPGRCRKCIGCQRHRQYEWQCMIEFEMARAERTWWCTFTYSDEKLSEEMKYEEFQNWAKRVRKAGHAIRYVVATERGSLAGRLHYHAVVHVSATVRRRDLDRHWQVGFLHMRLAQGRHVRYISKYATKDGRLRPSLGYGLQPVHRELEGFGPCLITRIGRYRRPWKQVKAQKLQPWKDLQKLPDPRPDWVCRCSGISRALSGICSNCGCEIITTLAAFDSADEPTSRNRRAPLGATPGPVPGGLHGGQWPAVNPKTPWGDPAPCLTQMEWEWNDEDSDDP